MQYGDDLCGQRLDDWVLSLVQSDNHLEHGLVLLVVLAEGEESHKHGKDLVDRDIGRVSPDHAGDAAGRVVEKASLLLLMEERLQFGKNGVIVAKDLLDVLTLLAEQSGTVGSVGANLGILVSEALEEHLHEVRGVRGGSISHVANNFGNGTDSGGALVLLLAGRVLQARLLEDLVEFAERFAEGGSQARNDLHGRLDDEPVVLGRFEIVIAFVLAIKVLLADVLLLENLENNLGDLLHGRSSILAKVSGENGRTAKLQGGGNVAVDVGDGTPRIVMSVIEKRILQT